MGFNHADALLLAALLVVAAVGASAAIPHIPRVMMPPPPPPPAAHPLTTSPPIYKGLTVGGELCCSPNGNCPGNGFSVGAATAILSCTDDCDVGASQDEVNEDGGFTITIPSSKTLNFSSSFTPCFVTIQLPTILTNCTELSNTTGILASGLRSTGTGYMKSLGGMVREATITGFTKYTSS